MLKYRIVKFLLFLIFITTTNSCVKESRDREQQVFPVVPYPNKILKRSGILELADTFWVIANVSDSSSAAIAAYLVNKLQSLTGDKVLITDLYSTRKHKQSIQLEITNTGKNNEAYVLDITSTNIRLSAGSINGVYYGIQTLLQILSHSTNETGVYKVPKMVIKDSPQLPLRGVLLSAKQIKTLNPEAFFRSMGRLKLNTLMVSGNEEDSSGLEKIARKYFVRLRSYNSESKNLTLIDFNSNLSSLENFYLSDKLTESKNGILLNLTSSNSSEFMNKMLVLAEVSWTSGSKKDFSRLRLNFKEFE